MVFHPARNARPEVQLILKFPQWYDRFHLFGYDPPRMAAPFDQIWVGTEVRNPFTRRMGFVQPTEGYVNFRWLTAVAGSKVRGAWFDHIECEASHFVDQAYQSVLAGAAELTLFRLGDIMDGHPGDQLLAQRLPDLMALHRRLLGQSISGVPCYKPPGTDSDDNTYLMDYLTMIGLPIVPVADYPESARAVILTASAAGDPNILLRLRRHLESGATVMVTPAFLRLVGPAAAELAGVRITASSEPLSATAIPSAAHRDRRDAIASLPRQPASGSRKAACPECAHLLRAGFPGGWRMAARPEAPGAFRHSRSARQSAAPLYPGTVADRVPGAGRRPLRALREQRRLLQLQRPSRLRKLQPTNRRGRLQRLDLA
jgi:hypothetical protein